MPKGYIKSKTGEPVEIVDAKAREGVTEVKGELNDLATRLKSGKIEDADLHLGFYLDSNGDLCQKEDE